jgi:hypothetical protein
LEVEELNKYDCRWYLQNYFHWIFPHLQVPKESPSCSCIASRSGMINNDKW